MCGNHRLAQKNTRTRKAKRILEAAKTVGTIASGAAAVLKLIETVVDVYHKTGFHLEARPLFLNTKQREREAAYRTLDLEFGGQFSRMLHLQWVQAEGVALNC